MGGSLGRRGAAAGAAADAAVLAASARARTGTKWTVLVGAWSVGTSS